MLLKKRVFMNIEYISMFPILKHLFQRWKQKKRIKKSNTLTYMYVVSDFKKRPNHIRTSLILT
jgi:hypothetical protein